MAKRPSEGSEADKRSFRPLVPSDFTYPDAAEGGAGEAKGQSRWASVKTRQAGSSITLSPEELTEIIRQATNNSPEEKGSITVQGV